MSKKELNNKLKLDKIDWAEVINCLDTTVAFRDYDVKRALKKTGRSFNINGPFHATVRNFIKYLGENVKIDMIEGEKVYTITSIPKECIKKKKTVEVLGPKIIDIPTPEKPEQENKISDEDKIRDLFGRNFNRLSEVIKLLAIFIKYESKVVSGRIVKHEFKTLGINYTSYLNANRSVTVEILKRLDLFDFKIKRNGSKGSDWILTGDTEVLEAYLKLIDVYKKLTTKDPENLDSYISSEKYKEPESTTKTEEKIIKKPRIIEITREEPEESKWLKWLLLESLKSRQGACSSMDTLTSWIFDTRYVKIDSDKAIKMIREMAYDLPGSIKFFPGDRASYDEKEAVSLFKHYDPRKLKETIYVKVKLSPSEINHTFEDLEFEVDEKLEDGYYIYEILANRSYQNEIYLKKLLRIIRVSGKIYTPSSKIVKRIQDIIKKEDSKINTRDTNMIILEKI